jgi:deazaflavin-dependent oxidoreductase (nitroreductase family)
VISNESTALEAAHQAQRTEPKEPTMHATLDPTSANAASDETTPAGDLAARYIGPAKVTATFNRIVGRLTKMGISVWGSRVLRVQGRKTGEWRTTPVNLLTVDGTTYLVSPRGHSQWVKNMRVAGGGELQLGRNTDTFTATELADADKADILRAYLKRWKMEVGMFFDGIDDSATDDELLAIAPGYPVFAVSIATR